MERLNDLQAFDVASHINQFCQTGRSGTIFLITETNKVGQIILTNGKIINIRCLRQRGMDALDTLFRSSYFKQMSFQENPASTERSQVDRQLPSQDRILTLIGRLSGRRRGHTSSIKSRPKIEKRIDIRRASAVISPPLAVYLGPMATIVCDGYLDGATTLPDVLRAVEEIAKEIDDPSDAATFIKTTKAKIQKL